MLLDALFVWGGGGGIQVSTSPLRGRANFHSGCPTYPLWMSPLHHVELKRGDSGMNPIRMIGRRASVLAPNRHSPGVRVRFLLYLLQAVALFFCVLWCISALEVEIKKMIIENQELCETK